jgi:hypothetical protein
MIVMQLFHDDRRKAGSDKLGGFEEKEGISGLCQWLWLVGRLVTAKKD